MPYVSKALEMSRKTPLTSIVGSQSKDELISWTIDNNCEYMNHQGEKLSDGDTGTIQGRGSSSFLISLFRDIEILGLYPAGSPSSDDIAIKIPYRVDVLLHRPASHAIFFYWVG